MNCYECALGADTVAAVATCHHCGVGLCLEHLRQTQRYRVGGTLYGCPHDLTANTRNRGITRVETANGHLGRVPLGSPQ